MLSATPRGWQPMDIRLEFRQIDGQSCNFVDRVQCSFGEMMQADVQDIPTPTEPTATEPSPTAPRPSRRKLLRRLLIAGAVVGCGSIYATQIEPFWLDVHQFDMPIQNLPA